MQIALIAFDNFTDLDLILHWDILNRVNSYGGIDHWSVRILGTKDSHLAALGLPIPTSGSTEEAVDADGVIICSGIGTKPLLNDESYLSQLRLEPTR